MSTAGMHVASAQDLILSLHGPGGLGDDDDTQVPEGRVALVIEVNGRAVLAVVGTAQQLRERVYDGLTLPIPAGVPLIDEVEA